MATKYDIGLEDNDLVFSNSGDFVVAESDRQHIFDTVNAFPGWWKENPLDGVGILAYNKSSGSMQALSRKIQIELESDGYRGGLPTVSLTPEGELFVYPNITPDE